MTEPTYLSNQFLIAMPMLADPNFFQTVTYISEHNASGALGLVINRPLSLTLGQLMEHLQIATDQSELAALPIYHGGPVQPEQGFVLHSPVGHWEATLRITDHLGITSGSSGGHLALMVGLTGDDGQADSKDPIERTSSRSAPTRRTVVPRRCDGSRPLVK